MHVPPGIFCCAAWLLLCLPGFAEEDRTCRVEMRGGAATFVINGRPHNGACYSTYDTSPENLARRVRQFSAAGCELYNFVVEISGYGYSRPIWAAKDRWDFSDLDQRARTILAAAPNAMLLPRIYIDAPDWWLKENASERLVLGNGSTSFGQKLFALPRPGDYASLASEKWRNDMARALETILDHIGKSDYGPRVVGYQVSGQKTEEWYHWSMNTDLLGDYSPPAVLQFRRWLRTHYGTDERLRKAWNRPGVTLDTATIPTQAERFGDRRKTFRNPATERHVIDFHEFWSDFMADTIAHFAGVIKRKTRGTKAVGAFYAYTFEFNELSEDAGHLGLGRLLESRDIDFLMAPSSYYNRNLPGSPYFRPPVASLALHGKMFWDDFDQVSYKWFEKLKSDPALKQWEYQMGLTKTPEEFAWMNRREVGLQLAQGAQLAHFDIHGGYYEDPVILDEVKRLIAARSQTLALSDRTSRAQILAVVDEQSEHYLTFRNGVTGLLLGAQIAQLGFVAPYDAVLLSDLDRLDTARYRLILMLNATKLDQNQRQAIRKKLACDGKTVVWLHAPGYLTSDGIHPSGLQETTGLKIVPDPQSPREGMARFANPRGKPLEARLVPGDQFRVVDSQASTLATQAEGPDKVVVARKRLGNWTSVYSAAAPLPAAFLRQLAAEAGVHLYTNRDDLLVFANRHHLTLAAPESGGVCEVLLPEKRSVVDLATGIRLCEHASKFNLNFRPKEVRLLFME